MLQHIYHICGHTVVMNMGLSSRANRIKRAEDMGKSSCAECELEDIRKFEKENSLPALEGSQKQVLWATKIRYVKLTGIYKNNWDKNQTDSTMWIEHRNRFRQPKPSV